MRIARVKRAVGGDRQIVRLIELIGAEIDDRPGLSRFYKEHVVLFPVGDEHPPRSVEADRVADAAPRQFRE